MGLSAAYRHDEDVNFSKALPSLSANQTSHFHGNDERYNAEFLGSSGNWRLQSEVTYAEFIRGGGTRAIEAYGGYAELVCNSIRHLDMVVKAETFDPDTRSSVRNILHDYTLGLNIQLPGIRHRVQFDYVFKSGTTPDVLQLQYQQTF